MTTATLAFLGFMLFLSGMLFFVILLVLRMLRSKSWDNSNMTNALRLISHMAVHPNDFTKMYYLTNDELNRLKMGGFNPEQPFWYASKDEFSDVVKTRP